MFFKAIRADRLFRMNCALKRSLICKTTQWPITAKIEERRDLIKNSVYLGRNLPFEHVARSSLLEYSARLFCFVDVNRQTSRLLTPGAVDALRFAPPFWWLPLLRPVLSSRLLCFWLFLGDLFVAAGAAPTVFIVDTGVYIFSPVIDFPLLVPACWRAINPPFCSSVEKKKTFFFWISIFFVNRAEFEQWQREKNGLMLWQMCPRIEIP